MPEKIFPDIIQKLKIFSGVPQEEYLPLLRKGELGYLGRGQHLFRQGDEIRHFFIVCSGLMQLYSETPEGREITVDITTPGHSINKAEILMPMSKVHRVSAKALEDAVTLKFPANWLKEVARHPNISLNILSTISQYAHMVEIESEHKSTMSAAQQVGCFLQRLCVMHGFHPSGFTLPYNKALIASRLGMEPETFSRALAKLRSHGIEVRDMQVRFTNMDEIGDYICGQCSITGQCPTHSRLESLPPACGTRPDKLERRLMSVND